MNKTAVIDPADLFKELIWSLLVKQVVALIVQAIPFLAWGPFSALLTFVISKVGDALYKEASLFIDFQLIVFKNKKLQEEFAVAAINLKKAANEKGIDSEEYQALRQNHREALSKLIRIQP